MSQHDNRVKEIKAQMEHFGVEHIIDLLAVRINQHLYAEKRIESLQKGHATLTRKNQELEKELEEAKASRGSLHITGTGMEGRDPDGRVMWRLGVIDEENIEHKPGVDKSAIENRIQLAKCFLDKYNPNPQKREYVERDIAIFEMAMRAKEAEEYATDAQMRVLALTRETLEKDKRIEELQEKLNEANRRAPYWQQRIEKLEKDCFDAYQRFNATLKERDALQQQVKELEEKHKVEMDGADERSKLLFEAKNHWADRARAAEAELERLKAQEPAAYRWQGMSNAHFWYGSIKPIGIVSQALYAEPRPAAAVPVKLPQRYKARMTIAEEGVANRTVMIPASDGNWMSAFDVEHMLRTLGAEVKS